MKTQSNTERLFQEAITQVFSVTAYVNVDGRNRSKTFNQLRRKKWTGWEFLASGEWDEGWTYEGTTSFYVSCTKDRQYWALLSRRFPVRIVCVVKVNTEEPFRLEKIGAMMMAIYRLKGGEYMSIDYTQDNLDLELLIRLYVQYIKNLK
jgi:hypothetical protein